MPAYGSAAQDFLPAFTGAAEIGQRQQQLDMQAAEAVADQIMKRQQMAWAQDPRNPENQLRQAEVQQAQAHTEYWRNYLPAMQAREETRAAAAEAKMDKQSQDRAIGEAMTGLTRGLSPSIVAASLTQQGLPDDRVQKWLGGVTGDQVEVDKTLAAEAEKDRARYKDTYGIDPEQWTPAMRHLYPKPPPAYRVRSPQEIAASGYETPAVRRQRLKDEATADYQQGTLDYHQAYLGFLQAKEKDQVTKWNRDYKLSDLKFQFSKDTTATRQKMDQLKTQADLLRAQVGADRETRMEFQARATPIMRQFQDTAKSARAAKRKRQETLATLDYNVQRSRAALQNAGLNPDETITPDMIKEKDPARRQALLDHLATVMSAAPVMADLNRQITQYGNYAMEADQHLREFGSGPTTASGRPVRGVGVSPSAAAVQIKSAADYGRLPHGAFYIDPKGIRRRKP